MGELGLAGVVRGKIKRTTSNDPRLVKLRALVDLNFASLGPWARSALGGPAFTYSSKRSARTYTAIVIDAYACWILGGAVSTTMTSQFVADAVEQAIWIGAATVVTLPG